MPATETMLSVAEVCELQPGDAENASWINPGFVAEVRTITKRTTKAGKPFWSCMLGDTTGSAQVEVSFFTAPKFTEGATIELSGQGLRRTEYNGKPQAAIGKGTGIHVIESGGGNRSSAREPAQQPAQAATREPTPADVAGATNGGARSYVAGQTVGMAIKEAINLNWNVLPEGGAIDRGFWQRVHETASDIIRLSNALEHGNLAQPISVRMQTPEESAAKEKEIAAMEKERKVKDAEAAKKANKPKPGPDNSAFPPGGDEDVPF